MEAGIVAATAAWGFEQGSTAIGRIGLLLLAPLVVFGIWGAIDFRFAGTWAEPVRLAQELVLSGVAAGALVAIGRPVLAAALVGLSLAHHVLVYALGDRLIRHTVG